MAVPQSITEHAMSRQSAQSNTVDSTFEAKASLTPELVIALCGPIGSPLHEAASQIGNALNEFGYKTVQIRLSDLIKMNAEAVNVEIKNETRYSQIETLIRAGDELRRHHKNDVLAKMAIAKISGDRRKAHGEFSDAAQEAMLPPNQQIQSHRICHVIDSIKNSDELKLLRLVYGEALFAVGVFSPLEIRKRNMVGVSGGLTNDDIEKLIDTDSGEEFNHGQSVRDTFPQCDFFLRIDESIVGPTEGAAIGQLVEKLRRLFHLIFKTAVISPTPEENAMYAAASAARNSACISRQVGAAVTSATGELLATGWNDVPSSGGGLYGKPSLHLVSDNAQGDHRCYALPGSKCHNDLEKRTIATKIIEALVGNSVIPSDKQATALEIILKDSRVKDLIEFSRAVHAEMHAILGASRVAGERVLGGKIYVTTYPCHSCARHIVAAGISEVYYIEPYRKSLATRLHSDALTEDIANSKLVRLIQFDGVAPRRFIALFDAGPRKSKEGVLELQTKGVAAPSTYVSLRAIPRLEEVVLAEMSLTPLRLPELNSVGGTNDQDSASSAT
jgi:deoxycytidylate deaminase